MAVAWGAFAFGAVYDWAYVPLAIGCAVIGILGLAAGRHRIVRLAPVALVLCLVAGIGAVQLIPLRPGVLTSISPATDRYLRQFDLAYLYAADLSAADGAVRVVERAPISIAPAATVRALGLFGALALLLLGLLKTFSGSTALRAARGIVWIGVLLAVVAIVQKALLGDDVYLGMRIYGFWQPENLVTTPFGPFVNKNHFAGWMILATPLAFGMLMRTLEARYDGDGSLRTVLLWLADTEGGRATLQAFAAFLMVASLLLTRSRSGLGCLLVFAALAALAVWRRHRSMRQGFVVAAALAAAIGLALWWAGDETALGRLTGDSVSMAGRVAIWRDTLTIIRDFPILGSGLNTFGAATLKYQTAGGLHYQEAHNEYLQILAEGGIVLGVAALLAIGVVAATIAARFRDAGEHADLYWIRVGATLGLVGIALQSTAEFSLQMPGIATLFVVVLAIAMYSPSSTTESSPLVTVSMETRSRRRRRS